MSKKTIKAKTDVELLQFAAIREIQAKNFYTSIAQHCQDVDIREIFKMLADEEVEHRKLLELEMMKRGIVVDLEKKALEEFKTEEYVIASDKQLIDIDLKDLLMLCVEKEDASFRLYVSMLAAVTDPASREVLFAVAQEEVKHKLRFQGELDELMK